MAAYDDDLVPEDIDCGNMVWDVAFHPTQDVLALGCIDGKVQVYGYAPDKSTLLLDLKCHKDGVRSMKFSPDGQCLYTVSSDNTIKAIECSTQTIIFDKRDTGHPDSLNALHFLSEQLFVTGCDGGVVQLWDRRQMSPCMTWNDLLGVGIHSFTQHTAKSHIIAGSDDGSIAIFGMRKAEAEVITGKNDDGVMSMCMINNDDMLATGCCSGNVRVWKYGVWDKPCDNLKGHPSEVEGLLHLKDGDVVTASCDGCVRAVRLTPTPKLLDTLGNLDDAPCMKLARSRCGGVVACAGGESVLFFDIRKYAAGTAEENPHGQAFLRQAADGEAVDMDDDEDFEEDGDEDEDDEDSDMDEDEKPEQEKKKHQKGKHRVDFVREACYTMMGGWEKRLLDMTRSVDRSTHTLQRENEEISQALLLGKQILADIEALKARGAALNAGGGTNKLSQLPKDEMDSFSQKMTDIKNMMKILTGTHQFAFNAQLKEYLKVHKDDFKRYKEAQQKRIELELKKKGDEQPVQWVMDEARVGIEEIKQADVQIEALEDTMKQRNKVVLRNEGLFLHSLNNVHHASVASSEVAGRYEVARQYAADGSWI